MNVFVSEFIGTAILLLLGNGVVANVVLKKTYGNNGGIMAITIAWAMAVFVAVFISAAASGAHLNPAITISLAFKDGKVETKPHGHGDIHNLLFDSGVAVKWQTMGKEWMIFI